MTIYGVALLAACLLLGDIAGRSIGQLIGIDANVGGVGIAMLLLLFIAGRRGSGVRKGGATSSGIEFWSAMYIPVVVAMAASQNVQAAVSGGWVAIIAGFAAVALGLIIAPFLSRLAKAGTS